MSTNDSTIPEGYKRCSKCGRIYDPNCWWGSDYSTNVFCGDCGWEDYLSNTEEGHRITAERELRKQVAQKKSAIRNKSWRETHPNYYKDRYKVVPEKYKAIGRNAARKRRSFKQAKPVQWGRYDESRALGYFHGYCPACGNPFQDLFGERKVHLDHWIPLSDPRLDNPGTVPTNMIPLCSKCNMSKHNHDPIEWLQSKFGPRKAKQIQQRVEAYFQWVREQDNQSE